MSWATDIAKTKGRLLPKAQGAAGGTNFGMLFSNAGVQGQPGGTAPAPTTNTPLSTAADTGAKEESAGISYGSGAGLIPGTAAYAEWQKAQASPTGIKTEDAAGVPGPDGPPEAVPAGQPTYTVNTGKSSYTIDRAKIDSIVNSLPANAKAAVQGILASGTINLGGDLMRQLVNAGVPIQTLMELQKAVKSGTGMSKADWMGQRLSNMNTGRDFTNYRPSWMQKRIDRNAQAWDEAQNDGVFYENDGQLKPVTGGNYQVYPGGHTIQPVDPGWNVVPQRPPGIAIDQLPAGFTPTIGDRATGQIMEATDPQGNRWRIGADGMPYQVPSAPRMGGDGIQYPGYPTMPGPQPGLDYYNMLLALMNGGQ